MAAKKKNKTIADKRKKPQTDAMKAWNRQVAADGFCVNESNLRRTVEVGAYRCHKLAPQAMGIAWMTNAELSQAIPPAYTEFIGQQLIKQLRAAA